MEVAIIYIYGIITGVAIGAMIMTYLLTASDTDDKKDTEKREGQ